MSVLENGINKVSVNSFAVMSALQCPFDYLKGINFEINVAVIIMSEFFKEHHSYVKIGDINKVGNVVGCSVVFRNCRTFCLNLHDQDTRAPATEMFQLL